MTTTRIRKIRSLSIKGLVTLPNFCQEFAAESNRAKIRRLSTEIRVVREHSTEGGRMFTIIRRYVSDYSETFHRLSGDISPNTARHLRRIQTFRRIFGDESPKCLHMHLRCWRLFGDISPTKPDSGAWSLVKISSTSSVPLPGARALLPPWTII